MFAKILLPGFGCTNIGDTNRPARSGRIRFMRGRNVDSISGLRRAMKINRFRRRCNAIQMVDKSARSFSSTAMRIVSRLALVAVPAALSLLTGCQTGGLLSRGGGGPYHVTANKPTPHGSFTIYSKQEHKRSGSYGFSVNGNNVTPCSGNCGGHYVGYPMGYWCEFAPGYGFHQGFVHPVPRTHGCIRLKGEAAPKFYALMRIGTPVNIASSQPEDETIGAKVQRVDDSRTPDPDPHIMISDAAFQKPTGTLLE